MLTITNPARELWDEGREEFTSTKEQTLSLEHSLISISKWEAKWHKPFLSREAKNYEETVDYIRCMTLTQKVDPQVYYALTEENLRRINQYIEDPMTATWFSEEKKGGRSREIVTSELIYYWMVALQIPWECEKWHLARLLTLIRICEIKNQPPKKRSKRDILSRNAALNAARRKRLNSKG